ncbi:alpha/beta fold hydrolase [Streptomyces pini]|uniref:Pimeloyl-ACP methyl ester carboxylesterase n=1 Tax=Streptomyces pini TaxID=1520580 RepID=A0A1I3XV91_9ACTN|nr:alpha/beta hydrolase [Streptomyces pini]SFK23475.1 Pimeloyl-ACP methyl ester carboxylesterase [Streptomyces pini]
MNRTSTVGAGARQRLLAQIPLTEHHRDLAGVPTAVLEGGEGPPMVILHGLGQTSLGWIRVIPDLVPSWTLAVPDLPGQGASEVPRDVPLTAGRVMEWLAELITATCPAPPVLVGHNLGGAVAARFASAHGDRLAALVLVDAFGLGPFRPKSRFAVTAATYQMHTTARSRDRMLGRCMVDYDGVRDDLGERWDGIADYVLDRARTPAVRSGSRTLMKEFALFAIPPADLAAIPVPTTLVWGRQNPETRLRYGEDAAARFGWPLHVIDDCGADAHLEHPDALVAALRAASHPAHGGSRS